MHGQMPARTNVCYPTRRRARPHGREDPHERHPLTALIGADSASPTRRRRAAGRRDSTSCRARAGLLLALFMWGHMFFVSSILLGNDAMWTITKMFEGYFFFGTALPGHRLVRRRRRDRAVRRARGARGAQVPDQLPRSTSVYRDHMKMMRHEDTTLWCVAGRHRLRAVLPRLVAPVPDADAPGTDRPVRVGRPRLERPLVAALPRAAASRSSSTAASACTGSRSSGAGSRAQDPNATRKRLKTLKWALTVFFLVLGLRHARRLHQDRHRASRPTSGERYTPAWLQTANAPPGVGSK